MKNFVMGKKLTHAFELTAVAAALLAVYGSTFAADAEDAAVAAEKPGSPQSSVSIGIGTWNNERHQSGVYDGMRDGTAYGLFDADILKRDDDTGTWWGLKARNLGLENRELLGEWLRQGDVGASLEYSRIPRDNPFTFNTGVLGIGTTTQLVPSASITPGSGRDTELGTVRDRFTAKLFKNLGVGLNFNVSFRNEDKNGTRQWGRGGSAEFAVEPINSTTRQLEAILSYSRDKFQLSGGYYGTTYDNANTLVTTALTTLAQATTYQLSLPLSNKSHEVFVNGGYNFTPTTRGTFKASYSQATQDEFLPTAAPGLVFPVGQAPNALTPRNLNGRLDTTLLEAGITAKLTPRLSVVGNLRYRDFADKTPTQGYVFSAGGAPTVFNTPFSYTNKVGKVEATYRMNDAYSLLGGIEYNDQDRQVPLVGSLYVPFRASQDETTYRIQVRKSMSETVNGSLAYLHSDRKGSNYVLPGDVFEDAINPINIADRKRDKLRAMMDWSPTEKLTMQFTVEGAKDKYDSQVGAYGLKDGNAQLYTADASYQLSSDWQLTGWISHDETRANEITQSSAVVTKFSNLSEVGTAFGVGVRGNILGKLKVGGDVEQFRSVNQYRQGLTGGVLSAALVPTPDITNKLLRLKLFAQYPLQKNFDLRLNLIHERWSTDDWSWMMFPGGVATPFAFGTTTDGTTVISSPSQKSTFVGARLTYKFQ